MPLRALWARLGKTERVFLVLAALYFTAYVAGQITLQLGLLVALIPLAFVVAVRLAREAARRSIWRLRNRLLVTYLFIAVVPLLLVCTLAGLAGTILTSQLAVYLVRTELDRRVSSLGNLARALEQTPLASDASSLERVLATYDDRFPGLEIAVEGAATVRRPANTTITAPVGRTEPWEGVAWYQGRLWGGAYRGSARRVTVLVPLTRDFLSRMVPGMGQVSIMEPLEGGGSARAARRQATDASYVTPPRSRLDVPLTWVTPLPLIVWEQPDRTGQTVLAVRARPSAVWGVPFRRSTDERSNLFQDTLVVLLLVAAVLFLVVEILALLIGVSLTRTITRAVGHLYEGTRRVQEGDFAHRISIAGRDQLGELGRSFNQMTTRVQELLTVAQEKQRMQAELEIAREVQAQLFPRTVPQLRTLRLTARCQPARTVSGDYYDYQLLPDDKLALVVGDVAGKGISAALLMATLQASLRSQLQGRLELAAVVGDRVAGPASAAQLVSRLNAQLHATTSPEKYATLFLAVYCDRTGTLSYTNAGHLPPFLVRDGRHTRLEANGMVVGAFPFARYEAIHLDLLPGDLLVCFTDGLSEPENEYGEMFGEERLIDVVMANAHRDDEAIIAAVMESVRRWTGSPELQDDMTMLLARRL